MGNKDGFGSESTVLDHRQLGGVKSIRSLSHLVAPLDAPNGSQVSSYLMAPNYY